MKRALEIVAFCTFLVLLASVVDICVTAFREKSTEFGGYPGSEQFISGNLDFPVDDEARPGIVTSRPQADPAKQVVARGSLPGAELTFVEARGRMWRGLLRISGDAKPGEHEFMVLNAKRSPAEDTERLRLRIFADQAAWRASQPSFFFRFTGVRPWWVFLGVAAMGALLLGASFLLSGREEAQLQAAGVGSIYKLIKGKQNWDVVFGLGAQHGIREGETVLLLDAKLQPVGEIKADKVHRDFSMASVSLATRIAPNFRVARREDAERRINAPA